MESDMTEQMSAAHVKVSVIQSSVGSVVCVPHYPEKMVRLQYLLNSESLCDNKATNREDD